MSSLSVKRIYSVIHLIFRSDIFRWPAQWAPLGGNWSILKSEAFKAHYTIILDLSCLFACPRNRASMWKMPTFDKFSGEDSTTPLEHISCFIVQCGFFFRSDWLKFKLFPTSLTGFFFLKFFSPFLCSIVIRHGAKVT